MRFKMSLRIVIHRSVAPLSVSLNRTCWKCSYQLIAKSRKRRLNIYFLYCSFTYEKNQPIAYDSNPPADNNADDFFSSTTIPSNTDNPENITNLSHPASRRSIVIKKTLNFESFSHYEERVREFVCRQGKINSESRINNEKNYMYRRQKKIEKLLSIFSPVIISRHFFVFRK